MIQCSISSVMYLPICIGMAASMGAFPSCRRNKGKTNGTAKCRDHDPSAIRRCAGTGNGDSDCGGAYLEDTPESLNEILAAEYRTAVLERHQG